MLKAVFTHVLLLLSTHTPLCSLLQSKIEKEFMESSFENTLEQTDYCVVLYDYSKVNPNDLDLK